MLQYIDVFCIHSQYNRNVVFALICIMHCLPFSRIIIFTGIYIVQCMPFFQMNRATISQYNIQSFIKHIECHFSGWQLSHIFVSTTPISEARRLCPVPLLRHDAVARISANWSAAFEAALPLAEGIATAPDYCSKTGPRVALRLRIAIVNYVDVTW